MGVRVQANRIGTYRTGDVLEGLLAKVSELDGDFAANLIVGRRGDTNATRLGDTLKPRRNIDAITQNIIALDQNIAEVDPNPVQHPPIFWDALVPLGHHGLHGDGAFDRIDYRGKLKQHAVPGGLDDTTAMFCHEGVGNLAVFAECAGGADLVEAHQPRVTGYVSRYYCRQPASDPNWLPLLHGQAASGDIILPEMLPDASLGLGRCAVNK
jgi:hypothetical protein